MKDYLYAIITGRTTGVIPSLLIGLLTPLSYIYALVLKTRGWLYDCGFFKQKQLPCGVISVGNIVAGGTGKTPVVIWIAKYLQSEGFQVAVLLRGYKRLGHHSISVISDGKGVLTTLTDSGDEADMIARKLPGVPVVVGSDRYAAGLEVIQLWGNTEGVLILDDGFQRRQLARDLDILTIDSTQPFGTGKLLPAGTLREPKTALKRADILLLTRTDLAAESIDFEQFGQGKQAFRTCHQPTKLYQLSAGSDRSESSPIDRDRLERDEECALDLLEGQHLLAVCGIGNPEAFAGTLRQCEPKAVELLAFPDHHRYSLGDLNDISARARDIGANIVVTTEKDSQKLEAFVATTEFSLPESVQFFVLEIELEIRTNPDALKKRLYQIAAKPKSGLNE
ncbi:tetraacyldisaccharide 4'-kinase [Candidatus Poribacteria bacterium]|nr:MAG: tetraacyldisaccharide 4'-kinase [Candidatus Poribacteria bacterium]